MRAAFAASSTGKPFPLAHGLLYEARLDLARYDWRHSVINSCAAAEVALSGVVRKHLIVTGHSKGEANDILDGVSGVMELFRLTAATPSTLGVTLDDVRKNLARPRNSAAHSGHPLDHNRAARAYQVARSLVDLEPLPTPEQILGLEARKNESRQSTPNSEVIVVVRWDPDRRSSQPRYL